ncbi:recombinase family protein [Nocardia abscessus]|uniref:recombinase family protein n=1 Tax=Nocardia abscessus TaxID=120957 RepID=UPI002458FA56|nr:recombinase family protein [Nocardia abscessus]
MERKGARQSRAQRQRAANGRPPRGVRATGYTLDGELIPGEAEVVRAIYQAFANGSSLKAIAAALSGAEPIVRAVGDRTMIQDLPKSVPPLQTRSGRPWNPTSIISILRNPRYAGWSMLDGEIVRDEAGAPVCGLWEAIVPDGIWLDVQRRLDDPRRKSNHAGTERKHLGSGLYLCGICDAPVRAHGLRYRCAGHIMRVRNLVDGLVLQFVERRLEQPDLADLLIRQDDDRIETIVRAEQTERDRLKRARADYKTELIDGELFAEIKHETEEKIAALETERIGLTAGTAASEILRAPSPVDAFNHADLAARRAVIELLCEVRLYSAPRGRKTFDPNSVRITPK